MLVPRTSSLGRFRPEHLFHPSSVLVLGSDTPPGAQVLANLHAGSFAGPILAADSPAAVAALPTTPELAVLCLADDAAGPALAALGARGVRAAIAMGMPAGLAGLARASGVRVLGPGSFGVAVPSIGLNASRAHLPPRPGRLALVSQSAALCRTVLDWAEPNGVGFSHIVGIGGNADLGFAAALDWLARDPGTGVILLEIRRIKNARLFLSAARAAARLRPVVAMRPGGLLLDPTGAADAAFMAALRRSGVLGVSRLEDLLGAAETLIRARPARGEALAIAGNAIGPAWLAADAALRDGLALAAVPPATRAAIEAAAPGAMHPAPDQPNGAAGADLVHAAPPRSLATVAGLLAGAEAVGGVLLVHAPCGPADAAEIAAIAAAAQAARAPLLVAAMGETTGAEHRRHLAAAGVPAFATPAQAVRGFLHLVQDRRNRAAARELPPSAVLRIAPNQPAAAAAFARARAEGRDGLTQDEAMTVLAAYHIAPVPGEPVADAEGAVRAAAALGYPVVVKRRRAERPAEGGRGAIALDLRDAEQVQDAVRVLERRSIPGGAPGFLVQRQVGRRRELRVRVGEDPVFGPTHRLRPGRLGGRRAARRGP
jgi:acetyltransferase